jgi:glycosyltransferase involved in cell wall biosynthesis
LYNLKLTHFNKFLFYLCGNNNKASSRVRGFWIAEALSEQGIKSSLESRQSKFIFLWFLLRVPFYQVVFFQKTYSRWHCLILRFALLLKKKTILDLDDAPSKTNNKTTLRNVEFMIKNVSAVTVGSQALYDYAFQFSEKIKLIPSSINLKYYQPIERKKNPNEQICLGWIGNGKHYKQDLISILTEPLTSVAKIHTIRFKLIGACHEKELYEAFSGIDGLKVDFVDQINWSDPLAVSSSLGDIDIGLYPLQHNQFNQFKCGFKAIEYMAMAIPVISSKVAENMAIIENNVNGLFAETSDSWKLALQKLIENYDLRKRLGTTGRQTVEKHYSIEKAAINIVKFINDQQPAN